MTQKSIAAGTYKEVPFDSILRPQDLNSRKKLKNIQQLAKSIEDKGLLAPLHVTNGGDELTLAAGWRRAAALDLLGWGNKLVPVVVVESNVEVNLLENVRDEVPALDLGERLAKMHAGEYPTPEGVEPKKYSKAELAAIFPKPKSTQYVANLIRIHEKIADEVKALTHAEDVPVRVLLAWAAKKPEAQIEAAQAWLKEQEALEKTGKTKRAKGTSKEEGNGGGGGGSTKPGKKVLDELYEILVWKSENAKAKAEAEAAAANVQLLRFVLGEVARVPTEVLSAEDKKAYKTYLKEEEQAEADAEAELEEAEE